MMALFGPETEPVGKGAALSTVPMLILYPHSRCNCRCVMCDIWRGRDRAEIEPVEVREWLPELVKLRVRRVVLSGGEALLNRRLREICETLQAAGIRVTVLSSGLLLERNAGWMAGSVDDVVVSLDGPEEIHDAIRGVPNAYGRLRVGIAALRRARPGFRVTARCVVQRANHAALRPTVRAARALGLDQISFLAADVSSEAFNRPGGWPRERASSVALAPDEVRALESELLRMEAEMGSDFDSGFIAESPDKLRERTLDHFRALLGERRFPPKSCVAPWVSCVVEASGDVRPCFFHPPVGNVREAGSLEDVVNSPRAIEFRQRLDVATDPICARCVCSLSKVNVGRGA